MKKKVLRMLSWMLATVLFLTSFDITVFAANEPGVPESGDAQVIAGNSPEEESEEASSEITIQEEESEVSSEEESGEAAFGEEESEVGSEEVSEDVSEEDSVLLEERVGGSGELLSEYEYSKWSYKYEDSNGQLQDLTEETILDYLDRNCKIYLCYDGELLTKEQYEYAPVTVKNDNYYEYNGQYYGEEYKNFFSEMKTDAVGVYFSTQKETLTEWDQRRYNLARFKIEYPGGNTWFEIRNCYGLIEYNVSKKSDYGAYIDDTQAVFFRTEGEKIELPLDARNVRFYVPDMLYKANTRSITSSDEMKLTAQWDEDNRCGTIEILDYAKGEVSIQFKYGLINVDEEITKAFRLQYGGTEAAQTDLLDYGNGILKDLPYVEEREDYDAYIPSKPKQKGYPIIVHLTYNKMNDFNGYMEELERIRDSFLMAEVTIDGTTRTLRRENIYGVSSDGFCTVESGFEVFYGFNVNLGYFDLTPGEHDVSVTLYRKGAEEGVYHKDTLTEKINCKPQRSDSESVRPAEIDKYNSKYEFKAIEEFSKGENKKVDAYVIYEPFFEEEVITSAKFVWSKEPQKIIAETTTVEIDSKVKTGYAEGYNSRYYFDGVLSDVPSMVRRRNRSAKLSFEIPASKVDQNGYVDIVLTTNSGRTYHVEKYVMFSKPDGKIPVVNSGYLLQGGTIPGFGYSNLNNYDGKYVAIYVYGENLTRDSIVPVFYESKDGGKELAKFNPDDENCLFFRGPKDGNGNIVYYYTLEKKDPNDAIWKPEHDNFPTFYLSYGGNDEAYIWEPSQKLTLWPEEVLGAQYLSNRLRILLSPRFVSKGEQVTVKLGDGGRTYTYTVMEGAYGLYADMTGEQFTAFTKEKHWENLNFRIENEKGTVAGAGIFFGYQREMGPMKVLKELKVPKNTSWAIYPYTQLEDGKTKYKGETENNDASIFATEEGKEWLEELALEGGAYRVVLKDKNGNVTWEYVTFQSSTIMINYDANGGEFAASPAVTEQKAYAGEKYKLPEVKRAGYKFAGWYTAPTGGAKITASSSVTIKTNHTLYARWTADTYKVIFDANIAGVTYGQGNQSGAMAAQNMTFDGTAALTANKFKIKGYQFTGWNTASNGSGTTYADKESVTNLWNGTDESKEIKLYAQWEASTYKVKYEFVSALNPEKFGQEQKPEGYAVESGKHALAMPEGISGYAFHWYKEKGCRNIITEIPENTVSDVTVYGKWTPITFTIKYDGNGSTNGKSMKEQIVSYDKKAALTANVFARNDGYTFASWNTEKDGSGDFYANKQTVTNQFSSEASVLTLYAQWVPTEYKITYKNVDKNTTNPNPATFNIIDDFTLSEAVTKPGYTFGGWFTDSKCTKAIPDGFFKNKKALTIYAKFTPNAYAVKYDANDGTGTMEDTIGFVYDKAKVLSKNTYTKEGFLFAGWNTEKDGSGTFYKDKASVKNLTTGNDVTVTLYAQWAQAGYTVKFDGNGAENAALETIQKKMAPMDCSYGRAKALTACAYVKAGYVFTGWNTAANGSGVTYKNKASMNLICQPGEENVITLYAQWKPVDYKITYKNVDKNTTNGNPAIYNVESGDASKLLTLKAAGKNGYEFKGWYEDARFTESKKVESIDCSKMKAVTLYAKFVPNGYTVTFDRNGADGSLPEIGEAEFIYDKAKALPVNTYIRPGYTFLGWNTQADGAGTTYKNKASVKNLATEGSVKLYAQWGMNEYVLHFDGNGADNEVFYQNMAGKNGKKVKLPVNKYQRKYYVFDGWNTKADGTGVFFNQNVTISNMVDTGENDGIGETGRDITLYAQWKLREYKITYVGCQNLTHKNPVSYTNDPDAPFEQALLLPENLPTKEGYTFGWYQLSPDENWIKVDRISSQDAKDIVLYARWEKTE